MPAEGTTTHPLRRGARRGSRGGASRGWIVATMVPVLALSMVAATWAGQTDSTPEGSRAQTAGNRSLRIAVEKRNDADGNGRFSRDGVSSRPGADVTFMVNITNTGKVPVLIRRISDSFETTTLEVCGGLIGRTLRPGRAVACTFTIEKYSPLRFDSRANTVGVSVKAIRGDRTAAAAAISTVTTVGSPSEVRGRRAQRDGRSEEGLAATGPDPVPLWAFALGLLATGSEVLALARRRGRKHAPRRGR